MESNNWKDNEININFAESEIKIANKIIDCDLQNFKGTTIYKNDKKTNLVLDIEIKEQKFHQRIFYKNEQKEVGYIEVFQNSFLSYAHELSENISFLFECDSNNNQKIDKNKCFGFRYYDANYQYCTLLKTKGGTEDDYFFLEKLNEKNNEFYDENLNCFEIVFYSIFSRYNKNKSDDNLDFQLIVERPLYEILGFSYSIILKSNDKFMFHKIHSINIITDNDFTSSIKIENDKTKLHIIPLLFDGHISLLFFYDEKNKRNYILSDPSQVHARFKGNSITVNPFLFPENIRKNLTFFPKIKVQAFNSCSLWYYFQLLCLINYNEKLQSKKYDDIKCFVNSINDYSYYFDCFEYYQYIMGFEKKLVEINPSETFNDEDYFYFVPLNSTFGKKVKIHKLCFLNQFVNLFELIELKIGQNLYYKHGLFDLNNFRTYNEEMIDFIIYLNYNINLLELNAKNDVEVVTFLKHRINSLNDIRNKFVDSCVDFLSGIIEIDNEAKNLENYNKAKYKDYRFNGKYFKEHYIEIKNLIEIFQQEKKKIEEMYDLYPLSITGKILFPVVGFLYKSK